MPRRSVSALILAALLFAYIVYPVLTMLGESLTLPVDDFRAEAMGWDPRHQPFAASLRCIFSEVGALNAISRTIWLSVATVAVASLWGGGLALLWERRGFPLRKLFPPLGA